MEFLLNKYSRKETILNHIAFQNDATIIGTNTASALSLMRSRLFTSSNGDRPGSQNVAIIMTDGQSNVNSQGTLQEAARATSDGTTVISIGIGDSVDYQEISGIAGGDSRRVFYARNENELDDVATRVLDILCMQR